jgi:pimeloyl-ACP methyl ester carboxylesterase
MKKIVFFTLAIIAGAIISTGCGTSSENKVNNTDSIQTVKGVPEKITFPSADNLPVTANLYIKNDTAPFIVLCHMAGFNKSEYRETAKTLMDKGYNCLAIDQRSGGENYGYENETHNEAVKRGLATSYLNAEPDIVNAVNYIYDKYKKSVILWGSSYSASLALKIGKENAHVRAIMAFSPGEYFEKDSMILKNHIRDIGKPVFITSSRVEANNDLMAIIDAVGPKTVTHFKPKGAGEHGSQVLWIDSPDNFEYWKAVDAFLEKIK